MPDAVREEQGFTLIELLVVILIIGLLAAIAIPSFLGQREKGQDTAAKADARQLVSQVEACFATEQTYASCTSDKLETGGLSIGSGQGDVDVSTTATSYVVTAVSKSGGKFTISRTTSTAFSRGCTGGTAGCRNGTW